MAEGHFARHIRRMRVLYAERRAALAGALLAACGERLGIVHRAGGMHIMTRLPDGTDDEAVAARAETVGLALLPLSRCAVSRPTGPGLLLGFTNMLPGAAPRDAARLAAVLEAEAMAAMRPGVPNL
jgi:GntR family transcriptional regulator/MocR family aminotransferase